MITAAAPVCVVSPFSWDKVEPSYCCDPDGVPIACYSRKLKADLLPGTFVLLAPTSDGTTAELCNIAIVARIVDVEMSPLPSRTSVQVNIFRRR